MARGLWHGRAHKGRACAGLWHGRAHIRACVWRLMAWSCAHKGRACGGLWHGRAHTRGVSVAYVVRHRPRAHATGNAGSNWACCHSLCWHSLPSCCHTLPVCCHLLPACCHTLPALSGQRSCPHPWADARAAHTRTHMNTRARTHTHIHTHTAQVCVIDEAEIDRSNILACTMQVTFKYCKIPNIL